MTSPRFALVVAVVGTGLLVAGTPPSGVAGACPADVAGDAATRTPTGAKSPADGTATPASTGANASGSNGTGADASTGTATVTERTTVPPCPYPRGAGGTLCEATPAQTVTPDQHSPIPTDGTGGTGAQTGTWYTALGHWLAGLAPLFVWAAAVAVVAPLVLGGLLVLTDADPGG